MKESSRSIGPKHRRPRYRIVDGFRMPLGFPPDGFRSGRQYRPQPGDLFVATYPKCGTTWMQHIVHMLVRGRAVGAGEKLDALFPHLEEVGREFVETLPEPRLIKTHLPLSIERFDSAAKFVYVARNPFDCAVSLYHHTRGFVRHYDFADGTFDDFFEVFITGEVDFGDYFEHLRSWLAVADAANVHFTTYEELQQNIDGEVESLGAFLGGRAADLACDAAARAGVIAESSFDRMSRDQQRWSSRRPADMPPFVRKGVVGDWQNHFTAAQLRRLLQRTRHELRGTHVLETWSEILNEVRARSGGQQPSETTRLETDA